VIVPFSQMCDTPKLLRVIRLQTFLYSFR